MDVRKKSFICFPLIILVLAMIIFSGCSSVRYSDPEKQARYKEYLSLLKQKPLDFEALMLYDPSEFRYDEHEEINNDMIREWNTAIAQLNTDNLDEFLALAQAGCFPRDIESSFLLKIAPYFTLVDHDTACQQGDFVIKDKSTYLSQSDRDYNTVVGALAELYGEDASQYQRRADYRYELYFRGCLIDNDYSPFLSDVVKDSTFALRTYGDWILWQDTWNGADIVQHGGALYYQGECILSVGRVYDFKK